MVLLATEASAADRVTQVPLRVLLPQVSGRLRGLKQYRDRELLMPQVQNRNPSKPPLTNSLKYKSD